MIEAEKRNPSQKLMFGFNHRYHGSVLEARNRITSGEFGNALWMRGRYGKSVDEPFYENWRANRSLAGGGILMDQGIHILDLLITSSMSYTTTWGKEVLTIAKKRTPPPQARHAQEERLVFDEDGSWNAELKAFFESVETGSPVQNGSTTDSLKLMKLIERIYENGNC